MQATGFEAITAGQREEFHREGILLIRGALSPERRERLEAAVDRVYDEERRAGKLKKDGTLHLLGFLPRDEAFGELLTEAGTFPYIWGLAGWNIYSHHNHLDVTPPAAADAPEPGWGWHQDGYRQNSDPEAPDPEQARPMFSLKIAYVLSDLSRTGRGATKVIPRSHLDNSLERVAGDPPGAMEITAEPGDCFIFDRRLWHSRSVNRSAVTRKMLFVGYTYRWIRPLDDMPVDTAGEWWANRTPVQRQMLGESPHTANYWGVNWDGYVDEKIPLRHELQTRGLLDRSVPWLR